MGAQGGRDEDWVEQQAAFEEILSQLHRQHPQDGKREGVCVCVCVRMRTCMHMCLVLECAGYEIELV